MSYNSFNITISHDFYNASELSLYNVTRGLPVQYAVVLFGIITPIFFCITVVANIMIVLVLSRPDMRTPTNSVLLAMAVADLLTLVFPVPWYFFLYTLGHYRHFLHPSTLCYLYKYMSDVLPAFFHTASIWCTLLLAAQSIAKIWCTNKRVAKIIGVIFLFAFVHQLLRFFEDRFENATVLSAVQPDSTEVAPITEPACRHLTSEWLHQSENVYFVTYFTFRILFVHIGPCLALVFFNMLLYNALKRAEKTRNKLFLKNNISSKSGTGGSPLLLKNGQCRSQSISNANEQSVILDNNMSRRSICAESRKTPRGLGSGRDANSTTFMLIVVVSVFLIVEFPLAITTLIHVTENVFELELVSDRVLNMTIIFSNFFIIISYPLNFAIYCGMSRAFRETFQQIFIRRIVDNMSTLPSKSGTDRKHSATVNSTADQSKQLDNQQQQQQQDLESATSGRTDLSPSTERISRTQLGGDVGGREGGDSSGEAIITDHNGFTQLASVKLAQYSPRQRLCETML